MRLTQLGKQFGDLDSDVRVLQTADQGKLTAFVSLQMLLWKNDLFMFCSVM